jgi:hypothetical protein
VIARDVRVATLVLAVGALCGCDPEVVVGRLPAKQMHARDAGHDAGVDAATPARTDAGMNPATVPDADAGTHVAVDAGFDAGPRPEPEVSWLTGAHAGNDVQEYLDFGTWRGRPLGLAAVYPERKSWDGLVAPAWPVDMFSSFAGKLLMSVSLYPEGMGNNQDCAAGAYDEQWKMLGTFLVGRDRGAAILRLGWGWNDSRHAWRADADPSDWIACFRHVVSAVRTTAPKIQIDWTFNPVGPPQIADTDPYAAYPGDDYVDYVGIEAFDHYPATHDEAAWTAKCNSTSGLCHLAEFARAHGKKLGIGEWGVVTCNDTAGGDNAFFVRKMFETFAEYTDVMGYEAYWVGEEDVCSGIVDDADTTAAAAEYQKLYGPR